MTIAETLKAAKAKIESPENWIQQNYAQDSQGKGVSPESPKAVCWCSMGAVRAVAGSFSKEAEDAVLFLGNQVGEAAWVFNDDHSHAEVLAMFDKAIAAAEKEVA
jgi:hypothetical protein